MAAAASNDVHRMVRLYQLRFRRKARSARVSRPRRHHRPEVSRLSSQRESIGRSRCGVGRPAYNGKGDPRTTGKKTLPSELLLYQRMFEVAPRQLSSVMVCRAIGRFTGNSSSTNLHRCSLITRPAPPLRGGNSRGRLGYLKPALPSHTLVSCRICFATKKGTGLICAKHPPGRSGKLAPSPFSLPCRFRVAPGC
jgi:hypothetical protein